jgi:hypothetical protein
MSYCKFFAIFFSVLTNIQSSVPDPDPSHLELQGRRYCMYGSGCKCTYGMTFFDILKPLKKRATGSKSIPPWHEPEIPDPKYQNVTGTH